MRWPTADGPAPCSSQLAGAFGAPWALPLGTAHSPSLWLCRGPPHLPQVAHTHVGSPWQPYLLSVQDLYRHTTQFWSMKGISWAGVTEKPSLFQKRPKEDFSFLSLDIRLNLGRHLSITESLSGQPQGTRARALAMRKEMKHTWFSLWFLAEPKIPGLHWYRPVC